MTLAPWDVVVLPARAGRARTRSATTPTRPCACSCTRRSTIPAAAVYPDSDKIGIWTGNEDDNVMVRRSSKVDYYDGEA